MIGTRGGSLRDSGTNWPASYRRSTFTRLGLMRLEERDCPSAPTISNFAALQLGNRWTVTGQIVGDDPGHATVAISGDVSGAAQVYADGEFDFVVTRTGSGSVSAIATDIHGVASMMSTAFVNPPVVHAPPHISAALMYEGRKSVTIAGCVSDDNQTGGFVVSIAGKVTASVVTDNEGWFSYTADAAGLGQVSLSTVDGAGLGSNVPVFQLVSAVPKIDTLSCNSLGATNYQILGKISDESPGGMIVTLAGFEGVNGVTATVASDGTYSVYVTIAIGTHGTIRATTVDWWGQKSPTKYCTI